MRRSSPQGRLALTAVVLALLLPGCSIRKFAAGKMADALAETGTTFASDDDAELVGDAVPFGLKSMEALLEETPRHKGLLLATASGFVQYAYAWVQLPADYIEDKDLARATEERERARKLYIRARDYGLRGLEVDFPGFRETLSRDPEKALAGTKKEHVPLLYWTGMGWAGAMALKVNDPELSADQSLVDAIMRRALALDETWELGSIHEFFISWEAGRASIGGSIEKAREHFRRAIEISRGRRAFPYVTLAESVSVATQDKKEFVAMLDEALAVDVSRPSSQRLANVIAQKRARFLLGRVDELFIE
jgi:predicted anti-sigma-YlaC factor YlaD